jgi:RNA polymerase sigma factor (sigma-70 family)
MSDGQFGAALRHLRLLLAGRPADDPNDRHLLESFARRRDESAFTALVQRHGSMVFGVCRRMLRHHQDAEDAFQATFLVLARKAGVLGWRDDIGPWLHEVATRVALKVRSGVVRRVRVERDAESIELPVRDREPGDDLRAVLDEELSRLPAKYRSPLVLCYLQGKTNVEAARELGWTKGTVSGRLARARDLLRGRLMRRGVTLGAAALAASLARQAASAALPAEVLRSAVGCGLGREASAAVLALADAALRPAVGRAGVVAATVLVLSGLGLGWLSLPAEQPQEPPAEAEPTRPGSVAAGWRELTAVKIDGFAGGLWSLTVSPDGQIVAAVLSRGDVKLYRAGDGGVAATLPADGGFVVGVAFSPDGRLLAVASDDDRVRLLDVATLRETVSFRTPLTSAGRVVFSPDGGTLAAASGSEQGVRLFATDTGRPRGAAIELPLGGGDLAFSADGTRLIVISNAGLVVWDRATRRLLGAVTPGPVQNFEDIETPLALSPDGQVLAMAWPRRQEGGRVRTWDVQTGRPRATISVTSPVLGVRFAPDGSTLAVCSRDGAVTLFDAATGKPRADLGKVETGVGLPMAFGGDGRTFAAGAYELKVWRFQNE